MIATFSGNAYTLTAAPLLSWWIIAALAGAAALVLALGLWRRAGGVWWRTAAVLMLLAILVNPSLVEEKRSPLRDVAVVVVDESPSQQIGDRAPATEAALAALTERLGRERDLDVRVIRAGKPQPGAGDDGTRLFTALSRSMSDIPRQRLAGPVSIPVDHGGPNVLELEVEAGPQELTLANNRAAVVVNGVRDRLRVLLVSGEPHAGERVWRNILKSDPSVDLVHFTILRPP